MRKHELDALEPGDQIRVKGVGQTALGTIFATIKSPTGPSGGQVLERVIVDFQGVQGSRSLLPDTLLKFSCQITNLGRHIEAHRAAQA